MANIQLTVDTRTETGKGPARRLRQKGNIPAILYGGEQKQNILLSVNSHTFHQLVAKGGWETMLLDLSITQDDQTTVVPALIKELQLDPVKRTVVHADFLEVIMGRVIQIPVPIEFTGEAAGVKQGGMLEFLAREVEIECLPSHILHSIPVDISALQIGDSLTIANLQLGADYKILTPLDTVIITVVSPLTEEVTEEAEVAGPAEPEIIQKGKKAEEAAEE